MLVLVATFVLGGVAGVMTDRLQRAYRRDACLRSSASYIDQATRGWELTATQRAVIDSLMDEQQREVAALYKPVRSRLDTLARLTDAINDSTRARVRRALTPEQVKKLEAMRDVERNRTEQLRTVCTD
jgi:hypothetical protein